MTLSNQSNIAIVYSTDQIQNQLLAAGESIEIERPSNGVLSLRLSLPYGSMSQKPTTRFRWLDKIIRKSSLFEDDWSLAVSSLYEFGGLSDQDMIVVVRRVEEFCPGYRYDCLFAEACTGFLLSEHHEIPDRRTVLSLYRKKLWRYILLMSCLNGGILLILGTLLILLKSIFIDSDNDAWVWGAFLLFWIGLTALDIKTMGIWESPRLAKATQNQYITNFFHKCEKERINL